MLKSFVFFALSAGVVCAADFMTGQAARAVVGQPTFTTNLAGTTDVRFGGIGGLAFVNNTLFATDANRLGLLPNNNRVLIFNGMNQQLLASDAVIAPSTARCPMCVGKANVVVGQTAFGTDSDLRSRILALANVKSTKLLTVDEWNAFRNQLLTLQIDSTNIDTLLKELNVTRSTPITIDKYVAALSATDLGDSTVAPQPTGFGSGADKLRLPTGVASDGTRLAIADTSNNRVLIWNSIPTSNGQPANVVLGQSSFTTTRPGQGATSMRGPQGVWIQDGRLFVADTQNNRVLIWNSIPAQNGKSPDLVLGQPDLTTVPFINPLDFSITGSPKTMSSPSSVTSDGTRLYVADLGFNRVLIWNSIPTQNEQPADIVLGQTNFSKIGANASPDLCASNGKDASNNPTYPEKCAATLNFPRFALSDGTRLFIADGGNDRVLVFNQVPTQNGARADAILGQKDEFSSIVSSDTSDLFAGEVLTTVSASDVTPTPTSLAWDGQNLYVADPTDYRILVFSPGTRAVAPGGVVNSASRAIFAYATVDISGTVRENDSITITIKGVEYKYTLKAADTPDTIATALSDLVNGANGGTPDANVTAYKEDARPTVVLVARQSGKAGSEFSLSAVASANASIVAASSGSTLTNGGEATALAAGALITIKAAPGAALADNTVVADPGAQVLPFELDGVQVYADGYRLPLFMVSPTEINAQLPWEMDGSTSSSLVVRVRHADDSVTVTNAVGLEIRPAAPGIFACDPQGYPAACNPGGQEPRAALAYHSSDFATGTISVDGLAQAGDTATILIENRKYTYTLVTDDTLASVRDAFIALINANPDEKVIASRAGAFTRIRLTAKVPGPAGNGIALSTEPVTTTPSNTLGAQIVITPTNRTMCCASTAGSLVTPENPAVPGETIIVYTTGLGLATPEAAANALITGTAYNGPIENETAIRIDGTVSGATANIVFARVKPGSIGIHELHLELASGIADNPKALLNLAYILTLSNTVFLPLGTNQLAP